MLLLDGNHLIERAHTKPHPVTGFVMDLVFLMARFRTTDVAIAFDSRQLLRNGDVPARATDVTIERYIVPGVGLRCVLREHGYQAQDMLAEAAISWVGTHTIATNNTNLAQMLAENVSIYNPDSGNLTTTRTFATQYGMARPRVLKATQRLPHPTTPNVKYKVNEFSVYKITGLCAQYGAEALKQTDFVKLCEELFRK